MLWRKLPACEADSEKQLSEEAKMKSKFCDGITRRDFVRVGVMGGTGLTLSNFLRLSEASEKKITPTADSCIFINLGGGPAHQDTLDMKPDGPSETRGEFKPIDSKLPGLQVCEHLPKLATITDRFALLRGIHHTAGAHPQGQSWISTGNRPGPALIHPSLGSVISKELPGFPDLPPYVAVPVTEWNAGYMGDAYAPLKTNAVPKPGKPFEVRGVTLSEGVTLDKVNRRQELLQKIDTTFSDLESDSQLLEALDKFGSKAHEMITSKRARAAFDVSQEPESIQKLFAADELSQSLLLAMRLVEYGVKFVTITNQGWDTHFDNFEKLKGNLLPQFDHGIHALISAMTEKGLLDRTLVVCMGEFGRTPKINVHAGRDHYPRVNWSLFTGGGVKTPQLIGGTDDGGTAPNDATDITPDDIAATIYRALGIDHHMEYYTSTGRPTMIVPEGRVISEIFA